MMRLSVLGRPLRYRSTTRWLMGGAFLCFLAALPQARAQSWTTMPIGFYPGTMVLMTDGTVLVHYVTEDINGNFWPSDLWERLTPDAYGNYSNGTWSTLPPMPAGYAPNYHATAVLPDGRLLVEGGEYIGESNARVESSLGAIYDPVANTWTSVSPPPGIPSVCGNGCGYGGGQNGTSNIGDAQSVVLPNGQFMLGNFGSDWFALFDAGNLSWNSYFDQGKYAIDPFNAEEGWVLLPGGNVLTVDLWNQNDNDDGSASMLYNPNTNSWSASGAIPVPLAYSACHEMGPLVLRPDGTVTAIGGNGQLATYSSSSGTWSAGPLIGGLLGSADGPAALLPDGNVLFQVSQTSPANCYGTNSEFFEWDGTSLTQVSAPPDEPDNVASGEGRMLVLPTGQILYDAAYYSTERDQDKYLFFYNSSGTYEAAWQPAITSVSSTLIVGSSGNLLQGTQLNGLSQVRCMATMSRWRAISL